ncbi:malonic semialdehyde reductase [Sphingomonas sp. 3P27F8]|uniref:malonic semialdehyde reductase n=1 Tax=Sphingomonas sp. 3P27F8 TaxID=2502213 RepID=UPI0010F8D17E|nr:malonic semialdehyde reductase [Sphingomonas sp. 3P27F8]
MNAPLDDAALDMLFRTARSYNGYLNKPIDEETCHAIWDLMKWGPTSANQLPARLVWCLSDAAKRKLAACVSAQNEPKILSAPATVILATDNHFHNHLPSLFPHNQTAKSWFEHDAALRETSAFRNGTLQGAYLIIAARALGLDTGPMSGFDNAKVDEAFFVGSPHIRTNFILTLGYGDPSSIFERLPRPKFRTFNRIW